MAALGCPLLRFLLALGDDLTICAVPPRPPKRENALRIGRDRKADHVQVIHAYIIIRKILFRRFRK